jgi:hypothetical protein
MLKFNCLFPRLFLKLNKVSYGKKLRLIGWPFIFRFPKATLTIGNETKINSNFWSNLLGLYQRTIIIARGTGEIKIGNNVGISGATIYAHEKIEIGDDCLIGANVKIIDNDFHPIDPVARKNNALPGGESGRIYAGKELPYAQRTVHTPGRNPQRYPLGNLSPPPDEAGFLPELKRRLGILHQLW